jgi:hypothetical protein
LLREVIDLMKARNTQQEDGWNNFVSLSRMNSNLRGFWNLGGYFLYTLWHLWTALKKL